VPEKTLSYEQYLASLPADRRGEVDAVWSAVRRRIPEGYSEEVGPKFLVFKAGAEMYVALANQKNYISLYLTPLYVFPELRSKLDEGEVEVKGGKSCLNFRRADELPLDLIGDIVAANDPDAYREQVRRMKGGGAKKDGGGKKAAKKASAKKKAK
jgi:hypothetical protein